MTVRYGRDGRPILYQSRRARRAEVHCSGSQAVERSGLVVKDILRTGKWSVLPTAGGLVRRPLTVRRDGVSDAGEGTISLAELVENFKAGAVPNVQIPLSDDEQDHKNTTALNTGFVRDLWIEDSDDGSKLVAGLEFTEPDIKDKVLRGTYADVSSGIPWNFSSRGKRWNAALEHVAITNRPFVDGLGPFLAASDSASGEVVHFASTKPEEAAFEVRLADAREAIRPGNSRSQNLEDRIAAAKAALGIGGGRV